MNHHSWGFDRHCVAFDSRKKEQWLNTDVQFLSILVLGVKTYLISRKSYAQLVWFSRSKVVTFNLICWPGGAVIVQTQSLQASDIVTVKKWCFWCSIFLLELLIKLTSNAWVIFKPYSSNNCVRIHVAISGFCTKFELSFTADWTARDKCKFDFNFCYSQII